MRKSFIYAVASSVLLFLSCETKESDVNKYSDGVDLTYFTDVSTERTIVMTETAPADYAIQVGSTVKTGSDRSFTVSVDPSSTATEGVEFTLPSSTATILSGEYVTDFMINIDYLNVPNEGATVVLNLVGDNVHEEKSQFTVTISKLCASYLEGTHAFVNENLTSGAGGGCTGSESTSGTVTWTSEGDGLYTTSDASFGQFATCWGDSPAVGPKFVHLCNSITATDNADQYGDTYTYTIVSCIGNELVMNWENTYGDSGLVTITREGGLDWQPELQTN